MSENVKSGAKTEAESIDAAIKQIAVRSNGRSAMMSMLTIEALELAAAAGNVPLAAKLLPMVIKNKKNGSQGRVAQDPVLKAFAVAAGAESVDMLRLFADWVEPKANNCMALRAAAAKGSLACVEFLLPLSTPSAARAIALARAAANGHSECVAAILPLTRAEAGGGEALTLAVEGGWHACIKVLAGESQLSDPECKAVEAAACRGDATALGLMAPHATAGQLVDAIVLAACEGHVECAMAARDLSIEAGASRRAVNQAMCDAARGAARRGQVDCLLAMLPLFRPPKGSFGLADLAEEIRALEKSRSSWSGVSASATAIDAFIEQKALAACLGPAEMEPRRAPPRL